MLSSKAPKGNPLSIAIPIRVNTVKPPIIFMYVFDSMSLKIINGSSLIIL